MMRFHIAGFVTLVLFTSRLAHAQCSTDNDCKGTRVCENQVCVAPKPAAPPPVGSTVSSNPPASSTTPQATPPVPTATPAAPPVAVTTSSAAPSDGEFSRAGFETGIRLGIQKPGGRLGALSSSGTGIVSNQDTTLSQATSGGFDLVIELGQRVNRMFFWGIDVMYAPSMTQPDCTSLCKNSNFRIGAEAMIHPHIGQVPPKVDPYLGFGVNYDQFSIGTETDMPITVYGMEFMNIQLGADYLVMPHVSAGLFFSTSFGMYFGADHSNTDGVGLHEWFTFGVRGAYRP